MTKIRCIHSIQERTNSRGLKQRITEFSLKNGKQGTEIVTKLDAKGNKGIRTIERDCFGRPEKVTDDVYNRHDVYVRGTFGNGVIQKVEGYPDSPMYNISLDDFCKY